jgi:hypothetical protein
VDAAGVEVRSDDLPLIVDAKGFGAVGRRWVVEGDVSAAVIEEAVAASRAVIAPDDLPLSLTPVALVSTPDGSSSVV